MNESEVGAGELVPRVRLCRPEGMYGRLPRCKGVERRDWRWSAAVMYPASSAAKDDRGPWWEGADRRPIRLTSSKALCPRRVAADPGPTGDAITLLVHPRMPRNCLGGRGGSERLAVGHDRPGDPRCLAGQRHRDNVAGTSLEEPFDPGLMGARSAFSPVQDRARAMDQEPAKIAVAALADPAQPFPTATGVLAWGEPEPCGEVPGGGEECRIAHGRDQCCRGDRADTGDRRQPPADLVRPMPSDELALERHHLVVHGPQLLDQKRQHIPGQGRYAMVLGILDQRQELGNPPGPASRAGGQAL